MTQAKDTNLAPAIIPRTRPKRLRRMAREPQSQASNKPGATSNAEPRTTKASIVEALLRGEAGATLDDLCSATGWQPHTCRAFLTGLRKKGHAVSKTKSDDGVTRWSVSEMGGV